MASSLPATISPVNRTISRLRQILQSPKLFGVLIAILLMDGILALVIPQQPAAVNTPGAFVVWVSNLPPLFRQGYEYLNRLGLFAIFRSLWFWLPASLVTWMSLLELAEVIPAALNRLRPAHPAAPMPPHPHSVTHQKTIRLAAPKDSGEATASAPALETLANALRKTGFKVAKIDEPTVLATRHPWGWARPIAPMLGVVLLIAGIALQTIFGDTAQILLTEHSAPTTFIGHTFSTAAFQPHSDANQRLAGGTIHLQLDGGAPEAWSLNRWQRVDGWWLLPPKLRPTAKITFNSKNTTETLTRTFDVVDAPLIFTYAPQKQTLELRYTADGYQLATRNTDTGEMEIAARDGEAFSLPQLGVTGTVSITNRFLLQAYRLPGLIPVTLGVLLLLLGGIQFLRPAPVTVQLSAVVKGRGSRIDATIETLGSADAAEKLAAELLTLQPSSEETNADT